MAQRVLDAREHRLRLRAVETRLRPPLREVLDLAQLLVRRVVLQDRVEERAHVGGLGRAELAAPPGGGARVGVARGDVHRLHLLLVRGDLLADLEPVLLHVDAHPLDDQLALALRRRLLALALLLLRRGVVRLGRQPEELLRVRRAGLSSGQEAGARRARGRGRDVDADRLAAANARRHLYLDALPGVLDHEGLADAHVERNLDVDDRHGERQRRARDEPLCGVGKPRSFR